MERMIKIERNVLFSSVGCRSRRRPLSVRPVCPSSSTVITFMMLFIKVKLRSGIIFHMNKTETAMSSFVVAGSSRRFMVALASSE